jgi:uncharacterized protein (UPF0333 family)
MILTTIVPFILLIIIIAVIFSTINAIKKASIFRKINVKLVLGLYGLLLLAAAGIFYLLPTEKSSNEIVSNHEELIQAQRASEQLTHAASGGKQIDHENIEGVQVKKSWDIPYEGNKLEIIGEGEQYYTGFTLVKRKDSNDQKVEVTQYSTRTIMQKIDFTNEMKPYTLNIAGDTLSISDPNQVDIKVGKFNHEFTITQFAENRNSKDPFDPFEDEYDVFGENVIYIQVPKDVEVRGDVQFVTE